MDPQGEGSTLVAYDLYLDEESNRALALSPKRLHAEMHNIIAEVGMLQRTGLLDVWESEDAGPATSFHSLSESHSRVSCVPDFSRAETWPDKLPLHVQGEAQLCNFSRDNAQATKRFVALVIERLGPVRADILCVSRGPGWPMRVDGLVRWERGTPLLF